MKIEDIEQRGWTLDMETFNGCITIGATHFMDPKKHHDFCIYKDRNDKKKFIKWARKIKPILLTFNGVDFDLQIIQYLLTTKVRSPKIIYKWVQEKLINGGKWKPFWPSEISFKGVDLLKINNFGWGPKSTSLKWLEFSMRMPKMADLPIEHSQEVSESNFSKILSYQKYDIQVTAEFTRRCWSMIKMLCDVSETYGSDDIMNYSDSKLGDHVMKHEYAKTAKVKLKSLKSGTDRNKVKLKKCILPYVKFKSQALNEVLDEFKRTTIKKIKGEFSFKGALSQNAFFAGIKFVFGLGGLHAAVKNSVWKSGWYDDDMNLIIPSRLFNVAQKVVDTYQEKLDKLNADIEELEKKQEKTKSSNMKRKYSTEIEKVGDEIDLLVLKNKLAKKNIAKWNKWIRKGVPVKQHPSIVDASPKSGAFQLTEYVIKSADVKSCVITL